MIIAFTGTTGSGKSTIVESLSTQKDFENIRVNKGEGYRYLTIFILSHPFTFIRLFTSAIREAFGKGLVRHKLRHLAYAIARTQKAFAESKHKTVLIDEGLVHFFLSLYEREVTEKVAEKYIRTYIHPYIRLTRIAFVDVDYEESQRRLKNRKRGAPRKSLKIDHKKWLKIFFNNSQVYKKSLQKVIPEKLIVLDARRSPEENVQKIIEATK